MKMVRNIIFDMGGVLLDYNPKKTAESVAKNPEDATLIMQEVFNSKEWQLLDEGLIDEESAIKEMCSRLPEHLHQACREAMQRWDADLTAIDGALELVEELKGKGYHLYLCSNTSLKFQKFSKRFPVFGFMDGLITSAEEKCVKPNQEIFQKVLDKFSLESNECMFIDDRSENVNAGIACGMTGIVFNGKMTHLRQGLMLRGIGVHK